MIETVELFNFLSHRETKLELEEGVNVFVGNNGSGKSSVIDALTYAFYGEHTRGSKANIVRRGSSGGYARVVFSVNGKRYVVERKFDKNGNLEGATLRDEKGSLIVSGERRQFGESVSDTIEKILGLNYEEMKVVAIIQQGELDKIISYKPKEFKELINEIIGIEKLSRAYEAMGEAIDSFKSKIYQRYGFGPDNLSQIESQLLDMKKKKGELELEVSSLKGQLEKISSERAQKEQEYQKAQLVKEKYEQLKGLREQFELHVRKVREELLKKESELKSDIPLAESYIEFIKSGAEEQASKAEESYRRAEEELKQAISQYEEAKQAYEYYKKLAEEVNKIKNRIAEIDERIRSLSSKKKPFDQALIGKEKELEESIENLQKDYAELNGSYSKLQELLNNYSLIEKEGRCPVCGSSVKDINVEEKRKHVEDEMSKVKKRLEEIEKSKRELKEKLKLAREAEEAKKENEKIDAQISILYAQRQELSSDLIKKEGELKVYFEKQARLEELKEKKEKAENLKREAEKAYQEIKDKLAEAKGWLSSKGITSYEDIRKLKAELEEVQRKLSGPDSEVDDEAKAMHEKILKLDEEVKGFSEAYFSELERALQALRQKESEISSSIAFIQGKISELEQKISSLEPSLAIVKKASVYIDKFKKMREEIFHRDGSLARSMRSWAVKSISYFATEYVQLFGTGISEVRISEDESAVGIKCYTLGGYQDIDAMSGGEKVAVAVAIRFAIARLLSSGNIDFVIMDEPTNYLDEERRKAFVDLVRSIAQSIKQLIIITHDREIFENESVNAIFNFEKLDGISRVTKY